MNKNFFSIREGELSKGKIEKAFERGIKQMPILDSTGKVKELLQKKKCLKGLNHA